MAELGEGERERSESGLHIYRQLDPPLASVAKRKAPSFLCPPFPLHTLPHSCAPAIDLGLNISLSQIALVHPALPSLSSFPTLAIQNASHSFRWSCCRGVGRADRHGAVVGLTRGWWSVCYCHLGVSHARHQTVRPPYHLRCSSLVAMASSDYVPLCLSNLDTRCCHATLC